MPYVGLPPDADVSAIPAGGYIGLPADAVVTPTPAPSASPQTDKNGQPIIEVTAGQGTPLKKAIVGQGMSVAEAMDKGLIKNEYDLDNANFLRKEFADKEGTPETAMQYGATSGDVDGVPKWGREHPNLWALYKTATGGIDFNAPTAPATGVADFATRVVPESAVKTVAGAVTAPYYMIKNVTDPMVNYAANITNPSPAMQLGAGIDQGMQNNIKSSAAFLGKPLGFGEDAQGNTDWSLSNAKNAWLSDPVGSALALAPEAAGAKGAASELAGMAKDRLPNVEKLNSTIDTGITKAIRPSVASGRTATQAAQYAESAQNAVKEIVLNKDNLNLTDENGEPTDGLPENLQQFRQAVDNTKRSIWGRVQSINQAAGGQDIEVPLQPAVDQLNDLANKDVYRAMAPETAAYAANKADILKQQGAFTVDDAQNAITIANQSLKNFYANPSTDTASRAYVDSLVANHLRTGLDSALEDATGSAAAPELRKAYGDLKAIEKDVNQRATVDARKNNKGLIDFSDIYTAGELVKAMASLNPAGAAKAGVMAAVKSYIKRQNDPNQIVKNVFQAADKLVSPVEIPQPPLGPVPNLTASMVPQGFNPEVLPIQNSRTNLGDVIPGSAAYQHVYDWTGAPSSSAGLLSSESLPGPQSSAMQLVGNAPGRIVPSIEAMTPRVPAGFNPETLPGREDNLDPQIPGTPGRIISQGEAMGAPSAAQDLAKAATGRQTWKEFLTEKMGQYMKEEGSHAAAMKRLSKEWAAKNSKSDRYTPNIMSK